MIFDTWLTLVSSQPRVMKPMSHVGNLLFCEEDWNPWIVLDWIHQAVLLNAVGLMFWQLFLIPDGSLTEKLPEELDSSTTGRLHTTNLYRIYQNILWGDSYNESIQHLQQGYILKRTKGTMNQFINPYFDGLYHQKRWSIRGWWILLLFQHEWLLSRDHLLAAGTLRITCVDLDASKVRESQGPGLNGSDPVFADLKNLTGMGHV